MRQDEGQALRVAGARREHTKDADEVGMPLEEQVMNVIEGLKAVRGKPGL